MKILLIGTIINDIIHHFDGSISRSLGGLTYSIQALLSLMAPDDLLIPLSFVGEDIYLQVLELYGHNKQINKEGLFLQKQPNNAVELNYTTTTDRQERSLTPFPKLPFSLIKSFLDADVLLLNMISGWDLDAATLVEIRKHFSGIISIDLHSLSLGRRSNGLRYLRPLANISDWIKNSDIIQANEKEFETLSGGLRFSDFFLNEACFDDGKIFNLTKAYRGSITFYRRAGKIKRFETLPPEGLQVIDPTGCGDAFMAGFLLEYSRSGNLKSAARAANRVAALTGAFKGLAPLAEIRRKLDGNS